MPISKPIYMDVCALSRPFDEQDFVRIRIETEAVNLILLKVIEGSLRLRVSSVHRIEVEAIPDAIERFELQTLLKEIGEPISGDISEILERAEELVTLGFEAADAAYVVFAEYCGAQFITCDEKLLKKCFAHKVETWCGNPVSFCEKERLR